MILLKPVLPRLAAQAETFLNVNALSWADLESDLLDHQINRFKPLMTRVEPVFIERMIEATKKALIEENKINAGAKNPSIEPIASEINYDDFARLDFRVARIVAAKRVEKSDKLLQRTRRQTHGNGCQPGAKENALRCIAGHGVSRRLRRQGDLPAASRQWRQTGYARQLAQGSTYETNCKNFPVGRSVDPVIRTSSRA